MHRSVFQMAHEKAEMRKALVRLRDHKYSEKYPNEVEALQSEVRDLRIVLTWWMQVKGW